MNKSNNEEKLDDDIKNNNKINISDINENKMNEFDDIEAKGDGGKVSVEEKFEKNNQSTNPYDLPDDF